MRQHLELHFESEQSSDDKVLAIYPSAIRRRVLRHLYLEPLRQCYLFKRSKPKFMDALLASCRTDLFMPNVRRHKHIVHVDILHYMHTDVGRLAPPLLPRPVFSAPLMFTSQPISSQPPSAHFCPVCPSCTGTAHLRG